MCTAQQLAAQGMVCSAVQCSTEGSSVSTRACPPGRQYPRQCDQCIQRAHERPPPRHALQGIALQPALGAHLLYMHRSEVRLEGGDAEGGLADAREAAERAPASFIFPFVLQVGRGVWHGAGPSWAGLGRPWPTGLQRRGGRGGEALERHWRAQKEKAGRPRHVCAPKRGVLWGCSR